jgi:hypothetical protein
VSIRGFFKGVVASNYPEWNLDNLAWISGAVSGAANNQSLLFWNDSKPGVTFYCYKLIISTHDTSNGANFGFAPNGVYTANHTRFPFPVRVGDPQPPGQMNNINQTLSTIDGAANLPLGNTSPLVIEGHYPIFVVPPNMGVEIGPDGALITCGVQLWYVWK